jgi:hypothetical protein
MDNPNKFRSTMDWWQQNPPMAWGDMYNEYIKYITSMTEIYKEYIKRSEKMTELYKGSVKSTERMTNHWLNKFPKPPSSKYQRREKQVNKLKDKNNYD